MEPISKNNCLKIGFFQKPHGVFGTLLLNFDEGLEEVIEDSQVLYVEMDGILVPWFIIEDGIRITSSKTALIDLEWINDETEAKKLAKKSVWIENTWESEIIQDDESSNWIGYVVCNTENELLGTIVGFNDYSGNLVLTIEKNGIEQLIPFHPDLLAGLDDEKRTITYNLPDGLIDMQ